MELFSKKITKPLSQSAGYRLELLDKNTCDTVRTSLKAMKNAKNYKARNLKIATC